MAARPLVRVYSSDSSKEVVTQVPLPGVLVAPIRPDVVQQVHSAINKNKRQAYSVNVDAGKLHSAESWGTGRAVSRIPRVSGGGTHRAGQAAFGNMCRKGRMFAPTKVWRKWHQQCNLNQRRFAMTSALAASALPALVMARGHRIEKLNEVPFVVSNTIESTIKTANAEKFLKEFGAFDDVEKVKASKKVRRGKGKLRNRRYTQRRGPLVVYANDNGIVKAFRNIPGVELCNVSRLNLLQLAPGGHLGRFVIWTQAAFEALDALYGSERKNAALKRGYHIPRPKMANSDLARIINSDEVQSQLNAPKEAPKRRTNATKRNPLKNNDALFKLNPYAKNLKRAELRAIARSQAAREGKVAAKRSGKKTAAEKKTADRRRTSAARFYNNMIA
eukprot:TRINITY_DN1530_c0_g1_i1.p2 TRINITY_DN1530_c0_g1~~TRINITY_DN1530_c0_g1_i1.p2  ORF type:complete len:389 (-),score=150.63 TRINITY_DN1530_c0_g1_i1:145-1311(-)